MNISKSKNNLKYYLNSPNYLDISIYNLSNKDLYFYFGLLFICFNFLSLIQHIILAKIINYESIFSYDSTKTVKLDDAAIRMWNAPNQSGENTEEIYFIKYYKTIKKNFKEQFKNRTLSAQKVKSFIHIFCIFIVLVCIVIFIIIKQQNICVLFLFDLFCMYYFCLLYFHFSEITTTLLRNCTTSIMFVTICSVSISNNLSKLNLSWMIVLMLCLSMSLILIIMEFLVMDHKFSFKGLQKCETSIMKKIKH